MDGVDDDCRNRTHEYTNLLHQVYDPGGLWDLYGIVPDVIVCELLAWFQSEFDHCDMLQPYTTGFPRADIHELLAPDLLHQIIKGVFKDHLVDWVVEYIHKVHGKKRGDDILADIDKR
jgi:hypothetical protein